MASYVRNNPGKRLTILSDAEKVALYGLPDFDDFQRVEFFAMTDAERTMALQRRGVEDQIYCLLQIGYFKAKQAFFHFTLEDAPPSDISFLLQRYFPGKELAPTAKPLNNQPSNRHSLVTASTCAACPAVSSLGACTTPDLQSHVTHAAVAARSGVLQPLTIPDVRPNDNAL